MNDKDFWMGVVNEERPGNVVFSPISHMLFPEFVDMFNTPQDPEWHPEGNVAIHTCFVTNMAAEIAERENLSQRERIVLVLSALLHDIAKPPTTETEIKDGVERITSKGHEKAGGPIAERILKEMDIDEDIIAEIIPLIENHLAHVLFADGTKPADRVLRRLRKRIEPSNIRMLGLLTEADVSGRPPLPRMMPESAKRMVELIENLSPDEPPKAESLLQGRHLIELGMKPGPAMGQIIGVVAEMEQNGEVNTIEEAIEAAKKLINII